MAVLSGGLAAEQEPAPNSLPNSQPSTRPDTPTDRRNSDWLIRNNQLIKNLIFSVWHNKELFRPGLLCSKALFSPACFRKLFFVHRCIFWQLFKLYKL
jgi:hypothetical protein